MGGGRDAGVTVERDATTLPNGFLFEDRYEILGELGSGSSGRVYRARSGRSAWQPAHGQASGAAHSVQNRAPRGFSRWQAGHCKVPCLPPPPASTPAEC